MSYFKELADAVASLIHSEMKRVEATIDGKIKAYAVTDKDGLDKITQGLSDVAYAVSRFKEELTDIKEQAKGFATVDALDGKIEHARVNAELEREQSLRKLGDADRLLVELQEELEDARSLNQEMTSAIEAAKKHKIEHKGGYKPGDIYRLGDIVARDKSSFICVVDQTAVDPRDPTDTPAWRLLAGSGDRGPKGEAGKDGEVGKKGDPGRRGDKGDPGHDGVGVTELRTAKSGFMIVLSDGSTHRVDLSQIISEEVDKRMKKA